MRTIGAIVDDVSVITKMKVTQAGEVKTLRTAITSPTGTVGDQEIISTKTGNTTQRATISNTPALIMMQQTTTTAHTISNSNIMKPFDGPIRKHITNGTQSIMQ